jgi:[calcium/calmodulin-dependent protein kinase] kinase
MEAELLGRPGIVEGRPSILLETTDSLTPPALMKEPTTFPIQDVFTNSPAMDSGSLSVHLANAHHSHTSDSGSLAPSAEGDDGDDEDDSGSDDGLLLMTKSKKKPITGYSPAHTPSPFEPRRRDTNASIMSTDTAKKVGIEKTPADEQ